MEFFFNNKIVKSCLTGIALLFVACSNYEMPEKISVKSKASYEFPLGNGKIEIAKKLSAEELSDKFNDSDDDGEEKKPEIFVYEYWPNKQPDYPIEYLIKYPIKNMDIDIGDSEADMDFGAMDVKTEIKLPDLNEKIADVEFGGTSPFVVYELGTYASVADITDRFPGTSLETPVVVNEPDFETMSFWSGDFVVNVKPSETCDNGFVFNAKLILVNEKGEAIDSGDYVDIANPADPSTGTDLRISLEGKTFTKNMTLRIDGNVDGGNLGDRDDFVVSMKFENPKIKEITGLNMTTTDLGDKGIIEIDHDFEFKGMNNSLKSLSIKEGSMTFEGTAPEGWKGLKCKSTFDDDSKNFHVISYEADDSPEGHSSTEMGLKLSSTDITDQTDETNTKIFYKKASLNDKEVIPGTKTYLKGFVEIYLEDATLNFKNDGTQERISFVSHCIVDSIKEMKINLDELGTFCDKIDTGLNISELMSDTLGDASDLMENLEFSGIEAYLYAVKPEINALSNIKFEGLVAAFESEDDVPKTTDSDGNETVDFSGDCSKGTFLVGEAGHPEEIGLCNGVHIEADKQNIVTNSSIFNQNSDGTFKYSAAIKADRNDDGTIKTESKICQLINDMPENLLIAYDFSNKGDNELTITEEDYQKLKNEFEEFKSKQSIEVYMLIRLPMQIRLFDRKDFPETDPESGEQLGKRNNIIEITDVLEIAGNSIEDDLLKRDDENDKPSWEKYKDLIESVGLTYTINNTTGLDMSAMLYDTASDIKKELDFGNSKKSFEFTRDDVDKIMETYPFTPKVGLQIPVSEDGKIIKIKRNAVFEVEASVHIKTNGTVEIWNKNEEEDE